MSRWRFGFPTSRYVQFWSSGFELYVRLCLVDEKSAGDEGNRIKQLVMSIKVTLSVQNSQFLGFLSNQTELEWKQSLISICLWLNVRFDRLNWC